MFPHMCLPRILLLPAVCDQCRRWQVGAHTEVGRQRDQSGQGRQRQRAHSGQWPRRMFPVSAGVSTGGLVSHSESLSLCRRSHLETSLPHVITKRLSRSPPSQSSSQRPPDSADGPGSPSKDLASRQTIRWWLLILNARDRYHY